MIIAVDFDGTVVRQDNRDYKDVETPLELVEYAEYGLKALKRAGHTLVLWSARASPALVNDWRFHPVWVRYEKEPPWWAASREVNQARYNQMVEFVRERLPGIFDAIDAGTAGKMPADLYIDDKARAFAPGQGAGWLRLVHEFGELPGDDDG